MFQSNALALRFVESVKAVIDLNREIIFLTVSDVQRMEIKQTQGDRFAVLDLAQDPYITARIMKATSEKSQAKYPAVFSRRPADWVKPRRSRWFKHPYTMANE